MAITDLSVVHRLSTAEYERMVESGALEDVPVELIDGLLVHMSPQSEQHAAIINRLMRQFAPRIELLRVQQPLAVAEGWVPEPDLALVQHTTSWRWPRAALLAVEVAVTQHREALSKVPGYAAAAIPQTWIVDVPGRVVTVFSEPAGEAYQRQSQPAVLDTGVERIPPLAVSELFAVLDQ